MKANELRVGNLVTWVDDNVNESVLTVTGIMLGGDIWLEWELEYGGKDDTDCDIESIKGIPLTEEWLFKFKFRCFPAHFSKKLKNKQSFTISWCGDKWLLCDTDITVFIQYVHQLQNLYFALTGKELTVKE